MKFFHFSPLSLGLVCLSSLFLCACKPCEPSTEHKLYLAGLLKNREAYFDEFKTLPWAPLKTDEELSGIRFFSPKPVYRFDCAFTATPDDPTIAMTTTDGSTVDFARRGIVRFNHDSTMHSLSVYRRMLPPNSEFEDMNYHFIPFKDATTGKTTYGGGRYLKFDVEDIKEGMVELDFNHSRNPWCHYSDKMPCPIPPAENILPISIPAGETLYQAK